MPPRVALLLAAGEARRLGGRKPLVRVAGRPLAWYPLAVLHLLGAREAVVVARRDLAGELRALAESVYGPGSVDVVVNTEPWRENGYSLLLGLQRLQGEPALVTMSDHLYTPLLPARLGEPPGGRGGYRVACDREPRFVDVEEATKVKTLGRLVAEVSKAAEPWACIDTGVHLAHLRPEDAAEHASTLGEVVKLNSLLTEIAVRAGVVEAEPLEGAPWTEVDTPEDLHAVEKGERSRVLREVLRWLHS